MIRTGPINLASAMTAYLRATALDHPIEPERQEVQDLVTARRDQVIRAIKESGADKVKAFNMFRTALEGDSKLPSLSSREFDQLYDAISLALWFFYFNLNAAIIPFAFNFISSSSTWGSESATIPPPTLNTILFSSIKIVLIKILNFISPLIFI